MDEARAQSPLAAARVVAGYLSKLRLIVNETTASRQIWIRKLGQLLKDAHAGVDREVVAASAEQIGRDQIAAFREFREKIEALNPPPICESCHLVVLTWMDKQIAACEVMIEAGESGELTRLRSTQGLLAEGRGDTRRFTAEYAELVDWVRKRLDVASSRRTARRQRIRWPFGSSAPS